MHIFHFCQPHPNLIVVIPSPGGLFQWAGVVVSNLGPIAGVQLPAPRLRGKLPDMKLTAVFEPAADGGYVCWLEEMPGVQSQGGSLEEARTNLLDALKLAVEYLHDRAQQESSPKSVRELVELPAL